MLKAENGFEAVVEYSRQHVLVTMPEIAEWVGDMVG